jgi:hypothetical protein
MNLMILATKTGSALVDKSAKAYKIGLNKVMLDGKWVLIVYSTKLMCFLSSTKLI